MKMTMNSETIKLLEAAKDSNGGGVWEDDFDKTSVRIARTAGWLVAKQGFKAKFREDDLLVITKHGRQALAFETGKPGVSVPEAVQKASISEPHYPPWRQE